MTARLLHHFFQDSVSRHADRPALRLRDRVLSYRELDQQTGRLASALLAQGAGPEVPIGVLLHRSIDTIVVALAVLKSGSFLVPLEPRDPRGRLALILEDTRPPVILTHRDLADLVAGAHGKVLTFETATELEARSSPPLADLSEENLAYVIYTSGSTGRPKGVAMSHRGVARIVTHTIAHSRADASWRTLQFASLGFDIFFQECFSTWGTGGTLEIVDEAIRADPRELAAHVARSEVERIFLPYVGLRQLAEAVAGDGIELPRLREVYTAGEQLVVTPEIRALFERHPRCTLFNHYGPTEAHVVSTLALVGPPAAWSERPSLGHPIAGIALHLVGTNGELAIEGQDGEIYIGGDSLARGYLNRPDITAQRFVVDGFSGEPGARLYKTGDIGRKLLDGSIQFLGRADHQIKVRGFRVELGEIEIALCRHPAVRQALVVARVGADSTSARLVAYVCPREDARPTDDVTAWVREVLPDYMHPASLLWLNELPLTAHGKVDLSALPDPSEQTAEGPPPLSSVERDLAAIWSDLLGVERVSRDDSFFNLGGHSLLAAQLASRASRLFGRKLSIRDITITPVLREQAVRFAQVVAAPANATRPSSEAIFEHVRGLSRDEASRQLATWEPEPEDDAIVLPFGKGALIRLAPDARRLLRILLREHDRDTDLTMPVRRRIRTDGRSQGSGIQQVMWWMTQQSNALPPVPRRSQFSLTLCFSQELRGPLDVDVLSRALVEIQQRHEILRCRFRSDAEGVVWQELEEATPLEVDDLQHLPDELRRPEARRHYDEIYQGVQSAREPALKARLLRLAPEHYILVLLVHHMACDAFSYGILANEIEQLYAAGVRGDPMVLGRPPYQYADIVQRRLELVSRPAGIAHRQFWSEMLAGATSLELEPLAEPEGSDAAVPLPLSEPIREALRAAARTLEYPPWTILYHVFARVVGRRFRHDSLIVMNTYGGRERAGADQVIGPLFSPIPIRIDGIFNQSDRDAIERLKKSIAETRDHTELPPAPLEMKRVNQLTFNYVPTDAMGDHRRDGESIVPNQSSALRLTGLRCEGLDWAWSGDRFYKLKAIASGAGANLDLFFTFDASFLRRADVEDLVRDYAATLQSVLSTLVGAGQSVFPVNGLRP